MASASAGTLQSQSSGSAIVTGEMVPSSSSTTIVDGQLTINNFHHQQQQKSLQQSQNLLAVQQQQQHHVINLQFHDSTATSQNITGGGGGILPNRHTTFVPRVGVNVSQQNLNIGNSGNRSIATDVALSSNDNNDTHITPIRSNQVTDQIISHQQQQNFNNNLIEEHHQLSQRQSQQQQNRRQTQIMTNDANVTPEWRRLISNNEVIYVSPSGASLRNHGQIENYLLSPGTCKCGLPCPLRPEYFFDFNPQVPNIPLQIPLENGLQSRSCMFCVHQRKYIDYQQQQNIIDVKKRKFSSDLSISGKLSSTSTSPTTTTTTQCNSVAIYSGGNVMQSSQVIPLNSNNNNKDNNNINNKSNNYNNNTNDNNNNKNNDNSKNNRMQIMSSQLVTQMGQQQQQQEIQEQLISSVAYPTAHEQKIDGSQQQQQQQDHHHHQQQQQIERLSVKVDEKQIGNVMISKTPPWRKNSILQQQQQQQQQVGSQSMPQLQQQQNQQVLASSTTTESLLYLRDNSNERVPPLPQSHLCQQQQQQQAQSQSQQQQSTSSQVVTCGQNVTPPWQGHHNIQTRFTKTRNISSQGSTAKKKPNFRDDPTGYLDHQTAILHNSILNVVQSPDTNDNVSESDFIIGGKHISNDEISLSRGPDLKTLKTPEQGLTAMQTQNIYHHSSSEDIKNAENSKMEKINYIPNTGKYYSNSTQSVYQIQQEKCQIKSDSFDTIANRSDVINPAGSNYNRNLQNISSNSNQIHGQKQEQISANFPTQQIITNVSSSQPQQQISIEETSMQQYHTTDEQQQQEICRTNSLISQPTTTSIGGQTVTHFPNGMVQVEQNCDNAIVSLKPQQQIQLQQQIQQHNILFRQNQQIQKSLRKQQQLSNYQQQQLPSNNFSDQKLQIPATQGSPVPSSTTTFNRCTPDNRNTPDSKGPPQVGAISTSNDSPHPCSSPSKSPDVSQLTVKSSSVAVHNIVQPNFNKNQQQNVFATSHTTARNTITSVTAGKTITATTSVSDKPTTVNIIEPNNEIIHQSQKLSPGSIIPVSGLQLQPVVREPGNQLIMTSTGQIIVMPSQPNKSSNQVIINSPSGSNLMVNNQQSVLIQNQPNTATVMNNAQLIGNSVEVLNNQSNTSTATNLIQSPGSSLVIQNSGLVQSGQNLIQSSNNLITANSNQNFIVNSSNNMQPVILNNSNIIQQNGQNIITANAANVIQNSAPGSNVMTSGGTKVISNNIIPGNGGIIGQQTVVLNTLPNGGYVIQPNFTTVDGQMVNQIVNQESGHRTFIQQQPPQQQRQIILSSPDSKRRAKKRKCSAGSSPSTPSSLSPQQSPTLQSATNTAVSQSATQTQQQQGTVVQIASQYPAQGFQIGPGLQGIVVNKNTQTSAPQQQIIFQNGQIIQPVNLIGQQLLVPAGLVVTPETTTLLQIQNVASCGGIITPQGMVLRAPSPQNKSFLSPNGSGQQFIVSGNNQMSPVGQIYGAPVGLVVPQSNSGTTTFVQQNTTIVQQSPQPQTQQQQQQQQQSAMVVSNSDSIVESHSNQIQGATSPPDTTTHSPRSPVRPPSERSRGSDMVQCVSSSEPDSVVSLADSAQSPSTTDYDGSDTSYQNSNKIYKSSSDTKIRRVKTPPQFTTSDISSQMKPDSHESPTNSPTTSATSTTRTSKNGNNNNNYVNNSNNSNNNAISSILSGGVDNGGNNNGGCISAAGCSNNNNNSIIQNQLITSSYCIGELVWGAARGHPAWPGKIVNPPDGVCTPSDSTWVQWFGCRPNVELVAISSLKSLSEGLEAHHKAQKDTRKSRKLNSQLERAIQEAMTELDRMSTMPQQPSTTTTLVTTTKSSRNRGRQSSSNLNHHHQRSKPVRIAPAPPTNAIQQQQQQQQLHHTRLQSNISQQQLTTNQQQQQQQEQQRTLSSTIQQQQQNK